MIRVEKPSFKGAKTMSENNNRAFMYGESVFTTMRMIKGRLCDWDYHFDRLKKGVDFVYGPFSDQEDWAHNLKRRLEEKYSTESGDKVIRISVFFEQERGLRRASFISSNNLKISLSSSVFELPENDGKMLNLRTCAAPVKPIWWPSFLKAGSYLEVILAQKMFLRSDDDDLLFLSSEDTVLESSVANIFVVRHGKLFTAPLGSNVLDGVMRKKIIEASDLFFDSFEESASTFEQLLKADAVFGTSSLRGPFLIRRVDEHEYNYTKDFLTFFEKIRKQVYL
jgi:branched-subunit amino acid aminotransferase/4-amino-4-deoxychorismate lyase